MCQFLNCLNQILYTCNKAICDQMGQKYSKAYKISGWVLTSAQPQAPNQAKKFN